MPKEAARTFLRITNVRVENLQDITKVDAKSEGASIENWTARGGYSGDYSPFYREAFAELWESTIKKADLDRFGWNENPWVWVYEFEIVI